MLTNAEPEHVDVLIVGAGLSGIAAAHHLQDTSPWATYTIIEARGALGGTWDLFRYPGIRSDSDMYTMGYSFRPWKGEKSLADGQDILDYITETAVEAGIDHHIRYHQRIVAAEWRSADARWTVTIEHADQTTTTMTCGFLFSCTGYYRYDKGHTPEFPGADTFGGELIHPQFWPEELEVADTSIVIIGSGATAVTLLPSLADAGAKVTMLQRSPTYIAAVPQRDPVAMVLEKLLPDKWSGGAIRWFHALSAQAFYEFSQRQPKIMRRVLRRGVEAELPDSYDIDTHFTPHYDPWDQRLCAAPGGDFFAAIRAGNAEVVTDHVETFTETGIQLRSGEHLEADIVVSATGLELLFLGGMDLSVDGEAVDITERLVYKGMMLEGVPNMAMAVGYTNASWTLKCDLTADYVARLLNGMRERGVRQATPTNHDPSMAPEPIIELTSGYFERSKHLMPKQGSRAPWKNYQSYIADYRSMKRGAMFDEALALSNPTDATELNSQATPLPA